MQGVEVAIGMPGRGSGPDDPVSRVGEANPCHAKSPGFHKDPAYFGKKPVLCRRWTIALLDAESTEYNLLSESIFSSVRWCSMAIRILWASSKNCVSKDPSFRRQKSAPLLMASITASSCSCPVKTINGMGFPEDRTFFKNSMPS